MVQLRLVRFANTNRRKRSSKTGFSSWSGIAGPDGLATRCHMLRLRLKRGSRSTPKRSVVTGCPGRPAAVRTHLAPSLSSPEEPRFAQRARISFSSVAPVAITQRRSVGQLTRWLLQTLRPRERCAVDPYPVHDDGKPSRQCHPRLSLGRALDQVQCPGPKGTWTTRACHDGVRRLIQIGPHQSRHRTW